MKTSLKIGKSPLSFIYGVLCHCDMCWTAKIDKGGKGGGVEEGGAEGGWRRGGGVGVGGGGVEEGG